MVDSGALPRESYLARFPESSRWENAHTGRQDVIRCVGPCDNLDGQVRVWLYQEQRQHPSNGWSLDQFERCWRRVDG